MMASGAMFSWRKRYTVILSFLRIWFYSSFLTATGLPISNGLEVEQQPVKACKKRSCLASPKGSANLFMLHRRVTFPTLSEVKIRSRLFWSAKKLSSTKIVVSSPMAIVVCYFADSEAFQAIFKSASSSEKTTLRVPSSLVPRALMNESMFSTFTKNSSFNGCNFMHA